MAILPLVVSPIVLRFAPGSKSHVGSDPSRRRNGGRRKAQNAAVPQTYDAIDIERQSGSSFVILQLPAAIFVELYRCRSR